MARLVARQPNGKLCIFSTIIDTFIKWNMTDDEYVEWCAEKERDQARFRIKNELYKFNFVISNYSPLTDSIEEFNKILTEMGCRQDELKKGGENENT